MLSKFYSQNLGRQHGLQRTGQPGGRELVTQFFIYLGDHTNDDDDDKKIYDTIFIKNNLIKYLYLRPV